MASNVVEMTSIKVWGEMVCADRTVVVVFYKKDCSDSTSLRAAVELEAPNFKGKLSFVFAEGSLYPTIINMLGLTDLPKAVAFRDGNPLGLIDPANH